MKIACPKGLQPALGQAIITGENREKPLVGELAALGLSFGVKALSVLLAVRREDRRRAGQKQKAAV